MSKDSGDCRQMPLIWFDAITKASAANEPKTKKRAAQSRPLQQGTSDEREGYELQQLVSSGAQTPSIGLASALFRGISVQVVPPMPAIDKSASSSDLDLEDVRESSSTAMGGWVIDRTRFDLPLEDTAATQKRALQQRSAFMQELRSLLLSEPTERGFAHPAEELIRRSLGSCRPLTADWIQAMFTENIMDARLAAAILFVLGHLKRESVQPWGYAMTMTGLMHPDIEVRDAAVKALESWGGPDAVQILSRHHEKVSWLRRYVDGVISDLQPSQSA
jgi:hypothetical protein